MTSTNSTFNPSLFEAIDEKDPAAILTAALEQYHPGIALASSFSYEDVMLIHILHSIRPDARVFALDTGRLNDETYQCAEEIRSKYGLTIEWLFPKNEAVEELERNNGLFSFRESVEARKACCGIRKVAPLERKLKELNAWITGQRREQSVTRSALKVAEIDNSHGGIIKFNPLAAFDLAEVRSFVTENDIPYNKLHDLGYPSIGCAPCTRAIELGEDERDGRWWWENPEQKECGLHFGNYQI